MPKKPKKPTYAQLERTLAEMRAALAVTHAHAISNLTKLAGRPAVKANEPSHMASGILLQLTGVGGNEIIPPVLIRDGLTRDTIIMLTRDIQRSKDLTMSGA